MLVDFDVYCPKTARLMLEGKQGYETHARGPISTEIGKTGNILRNGHFGLAGLAVSESWLRPCGPSVSVSARYCIPQCVRLIAGGGGVDWAESTTGYTFTPCVGYFTSPGIDTRWKGPTAFTVSSERREIHNL